MLNIVLAGLTTLLFPTFISDATLNFSNSVFSILFFIAMFCLLQSTSALNTDKRTACFTRLGGFLFSLMTAFGYALDHLGSIPYLKPVFLVSIFLFAHIFARMLTLLWSKLQIIENSMHANCLHPLAPASSSFIYRFVGFLIKRPFRLSAFFLLCWAPCYLCVFPGNLMYDASYEYYQLASGFTRSFPLLHSAIITRLFSASEQLTGSVNAGVAAYIVAQLLFASLLFSHIIRKFYRQTLHPILLSIIIAYYAFFPTIHLLVTCTTRDVLFSLLLTWTVYLFYCLASDPDAFMGSTRNVVVLAVVLVFTLLARNNNSGPLAAFLLLSLCLIIGFSFGRKHIRNVLVFIASSLVFFWSISAVLVALCQPLYDSPPASSMSILAQPIVRAYTLHAQEWPEEDRTEFESYFAMETLEYVPQNADPAKGNLLVRYANLRPFLKFWIKIGLRHPSCYLDAVLANTQQMWFPASVINGYSVRGMNRNYEKDYFYFGKYVEEIGSRCNWLPPIFSFYENIGLNISFEKVPMISMLFSIGFQVWVLLHCILYVAYRKIHLLFWPLLVLFIYIVCCAFVPLVLLRYFSTLFLTFPLLLVFTCCPTIALQSS